MVCDWRVGLSGLEGENEADGAGGGCDQQHFPTCERKRRRGFRGRHRARFLWLER